MRFFLILMSKWWNSEWLIILKAVPAVTIKFITIVFTYLFSSYNYRYFKLDEISTAVRKFCKKNFFFRLVPCSKNNCLINTHQLMIFLRDISNSLFRCLSLIRLLSNKHLVLELLIRDSLTYFPNGRNLTEIKKRNLLMDRSYMLR